MKNKFIYSTSSLLNPTQNRAKKASTFSQVQESVPKRGVGRTKSRWMRRSVWLELFCLDFLVLFGQAKSTIKTHSLKLALTLTTLAFLNTPSQAQVAELDSLALVALHEANPENTLGWNLEQPVNTWEGVTLENNRVVQLQLNEKNLSTIPEDLAALDAITLINLENNQLQSFTGQEWPLLSEIRLGNNQISEVNLPNWPSIRWLRINDNRLEAFIGREWPNLQGIFLGRNNISQLETQEWPILRWLVLNYNQVESFTTHEWPRIWGIYFFRNRLQEIQTHEWPQLRKLELQYNRLDEIETREWPSLEQIALTNNNLQEFETFEWPRFDLIYISGNDLSEFQGREWPRLTTLNIDRNRLQTIETHEWPRLEYFTLGGNFSLNRITEIQTYEWPLLKELDISGNDLTEIQTHNWPLLQTLSLASNGLNTFDGREWLELQTLNLSNNNLTELGNFNWEGLNNLYIHNNQLTFEDIIPRLNSANRVSYSNQQNFGRDTTIQIVIEQSHRINLEIDEEIEDNEYIWHKDEVEIYRGNENNYWIENITPQNAGIYTVQVTNPRVPGLTLSSAPIQIQVQQCGEAIESDSLALVTLYHATGGNNWTTSWDLEEPIRNWHGVAIQNCKVKSLNLNRNNLSGNLNEIENLEQTFSSLDSLENLQLQGNRLWGTIPEEIGMLSSLKRLDLSSNQFTGAIPESIGDLALLENLNLQYNRLNGELPESMSNLLALKYLYLRGNALSGEMPAYLGELNELQTLNLTSNRFSGQIPESLGNLENLRYLYLGMNGLTGSIPESLANLSSIFYLQLNHNDLSGSIPSSLSELQSLRKLYLQGNQLTDTIPASLSEMPMLQYLHLYDNNLTGTLPEALGNLEQLRDFRVQRNQIEGEIPQSYQNCAQMRVFYAGYNNLSGTIPEWISQWERLEKLWLQDNELEGTLPQSWASLENLQTLRLENNNLGSPFPAWEENPFPVLRELNISGNRYTFTDVASADQLNVARYTYAPQQRVGIHTYLKVLEGFEPDYFIEIDTTLENIKYVWHKDDLNNALESDAENTRRLPLEAIVEQDSGVYYYTISHENYPDLVLQSKEVELNTNAGIALNGEQQIEDFCRKYYYYISNLSIDRIYEWDNWQVVGSHRNTITNNAQVETDWDLSSNRHFIKLDYKEGEERTKKRLHFQVEKDADAAPCPPMLISHLPLDECGGARLYDQVWHESFSVDNPHWVSGKKGSALYMDGDSTRANYPLFRSLDDFSIAFWVKKAASLGDEQETILVASDTTSAFEVTIVYDPNEPSPVYNLLIKQENEETQTRLLAEVSDQWQHIVVRKSENQWSAYNNGQIEWAEEIDSDFSLNTIALGRAQEEEEKSFHGLIDEIEVYNYALEEEQIEEYQNFLLNPSYCYPSIQMEEDFNSCDIEQSLASFDTQEGVYASKGRENQGIYFPGIAAHASKVLEDTVSKNMALAFWVKPQDLEHNENTILFSGSKNWDVSGKIKVVLERREGVLSYVLKVFEEEENIDLVLAPVEDSWKHIALVAEGPFWKVYLDGELLLQRNDMPMANVDQLLLGNKEESESYFKGWMDQLRYYNSGISPEQIEDWATTEDSGKFCYPTLNVSINHNDCGGEENQGSISINPTDGIPPYSFTWSNGAEESEINNLSAGNYSVIVHSADGAQVNRSYQIANHLNWAATTGLAWDEEENKWLKLQETDALGDAYAISRNGLDLGLEGSISWVVTQENINSSFQIGFWEERSTTNVAISPLALRYEPGNTSYAVFEEITVVNNTILPGDEFKLEKLNGRLVAYYNSEQIAEVEYDDHSILYTIGFLKSGSLPQIGATFCEPLQINATITPVQCLEEDLGGSIALEVRGGSGNYEYLWKHNGSNEAMVENLPAGKYKVIVKDLETGAAYSKVYLLGYGIAWRRWDNLRVEENRLLSAEHDASWGVAGAFSRSRLAENSSGSLSWVIPEEGLHTCAYTIGLSGMERSLNSIGIEYACVFEYGKLSIQQFGDTKWESGLLNGGESITITRKEDELLFYLNNNRLIYRCDAGENRSLWVDVAHKAGTLPTLAISTCEANPGEETLAADQQRNRPLDLEDNPVDIAGSAQAPINPVNGRRRPKGIQGREVEDRIAGQDLAAGNYVRVFTAKVPNLTDEEILSAMNEEVPTPKEEVIVETQYFDGLGREAQKVIKQASPLGRDVISPIQYDAFGRQPKLFLPYTAESESGLYRSKALDWYDEEENLNEGELFQFYNPENDELANNYAKTQFPYQMHYFEASPRDLLLHSAAPGESWAGSELEHAVDYQYRPNSDAKDGKIIHWKVGNNASSSALVAGIISEYGEGALWVEGIQDESEENRETLTYKDKLGRIVLKRVEKGVLDNNKKDYADTYYVYDHFGRLRYVLPPEATKILKGLRLSSNQFDLEEGILQVQDAHAAKELVFYYAYDERGRVMETKIPGADTTYKVYDNLDRLVMEQSAFLRELDAQNPQPRWKVYKYDVFNRLVFEGLFKDNENRSREEHQQAVKNQNVHHVYKEDLAEAENPDLWKHGYYDLSYPAINATELLKINYYDHYDFDEDGRVNNEDHYQSTANEYVGYDIDYAPWSSTKGLITGMKIRILGEEENWLSRIYYYDVKGRVIQEIADHHLEGRDVTTTKYTFTGQVEATHWQHNREEGLEGLQVKKRYEYDHMDRLLRAYHQINENPEEMLLTHQYNEKGELVNKIWGDSIQEVNYAYNIRGWLLNMNEPENIDAQHLFAHELRYDVGVEEPKYDGNIANTLWSSITDNKVRAYGYAYDAMSRLKDAEYYLKERGDSWNATLPGENHEISHLQYDDQGNIQFIQRHGKMEQEYGISDQLKYYYNPINPNSLIGVEDDVEAEVLTPNFLDGLEPYIESGDAEYSYDIAGNMKMDANKGIERIQYNHLHLPEVVVKEGGTRIQYTYNAEGIKLKKEVFQNGEAISQNDYVNEVLYENSAVNAIQTTEGRYVPEQGYEYHYKDHLGNFRLSLRDGRDWKMTAEEENAEEEEQTFENLEEYRNEDNARSGNHSVKLFSGDPDDPQSYVYTEAISANRGATIIAEVWAASNEPQDNERVEGRSVFFPKVGISLGQPTQIKGEVQKEKSKRPGVQFNILGLFNKKDNVIGRGAPIGGGGEDDLGSEKAILVISLLDENGNVVEEERKEIGVTSNWKKLTASILIDHEDFNDNWQIKIAILARSLSWIWFDDMSIAEKFILQEEDYYPFGLAFNSYNNTAAVGSGNENRVKFNGREQQKEIGLYDYKRRFYDPALGRFISLDPLANSFPWWTPYQFAGLMPTKYVDLDGMEPAYYDPQSGTIIPASDHIRHEPPADAQFFSSGGSPDPSYEIALGFTPAGVVLDVLDLATSIEDGDGLGITLSAIGFLPGGDFVKSARKLSKAAEIKGGVYILKDPIDGTIKRTGRTKNLKIRESQHAKSIETKDLEFQGVYKTDNYAEQRGLENKLYDKFKNTASKENGGLNKIKPIRDNNPRKKEYEKAAEKYLKKS